MKKYTNTICTAVKNANKGDILKVLNPYNQEVVGEIEKTTQEQMSEIINIAYETFNNKSKKLKTYERIEILQKVISYMKEDFDEILSLTIKEGSKPYNDSKVEVNRAIDSLQSCVDTLRTSHGEEIPMGISPSSENRLALRTNEPIGVVLALSAFNHPVNLIAHQIGPAIAMGCPVIVKPSSETPLSCFNMVELFHKAGLPKEFAQAVIPQDRDTLNMLTTSPKIAFLSFIGSAKVGWMLRSNVANGVRCALEHGGVAPVIVTASAKSMLDDAVASIAKGGFYHAGQVCVSSQRIFVHKDIFDEFSKKMVDVANNLKVCDSLDESCEVGALINENEVQRVDEWVQDAIKNGGKLACGGKALGNNLYAPTVLLNPSQDAIISQKEIFGPVVVLYSYESESEAVALANSLDVSFQASVFASDISTAMYVYKNINAAACMVNDHSAFRVDWMPFAGHKHSGLSTGGIKYTMEEMSAKKLLVIKDINL